jgi:hypothetical protein
LLEEIQRKARRSFSPLRETNPARWDHLFWKGRAVADAVHNAMIATLNAPKDDRLSHRAESDLFNIGFYTFRIWGTSLNLCPD